MKTCNEEELKDSLYGARSLFAWSLFFKEYMLTINHQFDPGHRIDHVQRVYQNVMWLSQFEKVNFKVMIPAVWLHDCVPIEKNSPQRAMASTLSAQAAVELLKSWNYPRDYLEAISHAIATHSFSAGIAPESLEAQVMQDADRLDALGAIGIARVMMTGARFNNCLYDCEQPFPVTRELAEDTFILDHFYTKLLNLHKTFQTKSGMVEAKQRTQVMHRYLETLGSEIGVAYRLAEVV